MKIYFKNDWPSNKQATRFIALANSLMNDQDFIDEIAKVDSFSMSNATPLEISRYINQFTGTILVKFYKGKRWSRALAYFSPSKPFEININTRKMNRSDGSLVATCVHELIHAVDKSITNRSFGHGDNRWTKAKEFTAPYYIDKIAEAFIDEKPIHEANVNDNQAIPTVTKPTKMIAKRFVWWNPFSWF